MSDIDWYALICRATPQNVGPLLPHHNFKYLLLIDYLLVQTSIFEKF